MSTDNKIRHFKTQMNNVYLGENLGYTQSNKAVRKLGKD